MALAVRLFYVCGWLECVCVYTIIGRSFEVGKSNFNLKLLKIVYIILSRSHLTAVAHIHSIFF